MVISLGRPVTPQGIRAIRISCSTAPQRRASRQRRNEAVIEKLDAFKTIFREAIVGTSELTTLLRQTAREQKAGEKEVQIRPTDPAVSLLTYKPRLAGKLNWDEVAEGFVIRALGPPSLQIPLPL